MRLQRTGMTLIEVCAAVTLSAAMMAVAVSLLHGLFMAERSTRESIRENGVVNSLADQFRRDAHATPVAGVSAGDGLQFAPDADRTVNYRVEAGEVVRAESTGRGVRRQPFPLPPGTAATFEGPAEKGPAIVRLVIARAEAEDRLAAGLPLPIVVEAVCGRDHRFDLPVDPAGEEIDE